MLGRTRSTYWKAADDPHRHTQKASAKKDIQAKNLLAVMQQCWPLHHQNALLNFLTFFFYPFNWSIPEGCFTLSRKKSPSTAIVATVKWNVLFIHVKQRACTAVIYISVTKLHSCSLNSKFSFVTFFSSNVDLWLVDGLASLLWLC